MKKNYLNFGLLSILLIVCFAFTACGSDDDNSTSGTTPTVNGKRIVSVVEVSDNTSSTWKYEYNSKGQIIQKKIDYNTTTYVYENSKITSSESGLSNIKRTYTLSNSRIVSDSRGYKYEYDSNGYLQKVSDSDGWNTTEYTWENGNITKILDISGNTIRTLNYTYSNISTVLPCFAYFEDDVLEMQGYFGKKCKNLPSKVIINGEGYTYYVTLDYTLTDNVVTRAIFQYPNYIEIFTFNWE